MSLDYDLYVINPTNRGTSMYQLRDCLGDAIDELAKRTASLSERLNKLENEADAADNNALSKEPLIEDAECRGVMRLWADRCGVKTVTLFGSEFRCGGRSISFGVDFGLEHPKLYTIDELCGEERE